jgi:hypothetical protein
MSTLFVEKNPRSILALVSKRYAECRTYVDSGEVVSIIRGTERERIRFATAFARDRSFRFEARVTHVRLGEAGIRIDALDGKAIAAAVPSTAGSAQRIPRLLKGRSAALDSTFGQRITKFVRVERVSDEKHGGFPCARLRGVRHQRHLIFELWISRDALIRRIIVEDPSIGLVATSDYDPSVNKQIDWSQNALLATG